jgi:dTDP-4-amino-4,6-dideoxygalactose transaminase
MSIKLVDLHAQYLSIRSEIDAAIASVIADTAFIGGKYVTAFEEQFAAYVGTPYCVGCGNGTDALEIALVALGIGKGDEVIVPAHTWISTAEAVTTAGATPVFVDTNPLTYTIDPNLIEQKITPRTRAIIPVHLYGLPAEMDEILALARKYRLRVVEDCAQAHGAKYKGRTVGSFGDAAAFSFYPGKNLGAYGDAGCIVTADDQVARTARMIANHGRLSKHDHALEGRNSRLDGLQAAILSVKLPHLEKWNEARRKNAELYRSHLEGTGIEPPVAPQHSRHVYHLYVVQVPDRDHVATTLKSRNIETGVHYPVPLPFLQAYQRMRHEPSHFPVASRQMTRILSLPMYADLPESSISFICETLRQCNQHKSSND